MKWGKVLFEKTLVVQCGLGEDAAERQSAAVSFARAIAKEQGVAFEKGAAEDLAECVAARFDAPENRDRKAHNLRSRKKVHHQKRCQRHGDFRQENDSVGTCRYSGGKKICESARVSRPAAPRRRGAVVHGRSIGLDVSQAHRSQAK